MRTNLILLAAMLIGSAAVRVKGGGDEQQRATDLNLDSNCVGPTDRDPIPSVEPAAREPAAWLLKRYEAIAAELMAVASEDRRGQ